MAPLIPLIPASEPRLSGHFDSAQRPLELRVRRELPDQSRMTRLPFDRDGRIVARGKYDTRGAPGYKLPTAHTGITWLRAWE